MTSNALIAAADVSVIIPTYNRVSFLARAVDSVLSQTVRPREVIVVDDGSTDGTAELIRGYHGSVTYLYQDNQGVSAARNNGIKSATSKYIAFLDSDDYWAPDKIEYQVDVLESNQQLVAHVCNISWFYLNQISVHPFWLRSKKMSAVTSGVMQLPLAWVLQDSVAVVQSIMIRSDVCERSGLFDPTLSLWEDTDFSARVAFCGPWAYVDKPMVFIRDIHEGEDRLSRSRSTDLSHSYNIRRNVLLALAGNQYAKESDQQVISDELSVVCFALGGLRGRNGAIKEAANFYFESFKRGIKLKSVLMMLLLFGTAGVGHWLMKRLDERDSFHI